MLLLLFSGNALPLEQSQLFLKAQSFKLFIDMSCSTKVYTWYFSQEISFTEIF